MAREPLSIQGYSHTRQFCTWPDCTSVTLPKMAVRVAVVGCGYWGRNLVRVFHELEALCAVCDVNAGLAAKFSSEYSVPSLDWVKILEDRSIDAVAIATPAKGHSTQALEALQAGKHAFVEKPLALCSYEAEEIIATADRGDRVLMVGHLLQYHPAFLTLRDLADAGKLGQLQYIYSNRLNFGKVRREENVFWSFAPHDISMILSLTGEMPNSILAKGASYLHNAIADVTNTYLTFPSGVNAHIFVSWLHPFKEQKLIVVGSDSMVVFDDMKDWGEKLQLYPHRIGWHEGLPDPERGEAELVAVEQGEPLKIEGQHFIDCVRDGGTPRTNGAEALRVLRVLEATERRLTEQHSGESQ